MNRARILILEDDPQWLQTLYQILSPVADHVFSAATLPEALDLVVRRYFNVAIVDISLRMGDPSDIQGLQFLQQLREQKLDDAIRCIVLSAYGTIRRVRELFRDYCVTDFLEKGQFQASDLLNAIARALAAHNLDRDLDIRTTSGSDLDSLWEKFTWARREDPFQLRPELYDLLSRLFPEAQSLFIRDLPTGQSGAGVLQVEPCYNYGTGSPVIVKFGKREKIAQERDNYRQYVEQYAGTYSSTQLRCVLGRVMGAIGYHLIGTESNRVASFAQYYRQRDTDAVCNALDHLFRHTCGRWYDNRPGPRLSQNLMELYEKGLHLDWAEVWAGAMKAHIELMAEKIEFPGLPGSYVNPKIWLSKHAQDAYIPTWSTVTHGDLNEHNVLVTEEGNCWLIDFYRTGPGHIFRDMVELETAIKFNLVEINDLVEYYRFERRLLEQSRLDQPVEVGPRHPYRKPLKVIGYLRELANQWAGRNNEMTEYFWALLLTTLNLLRLDFMQEKHRKILLSAAMLCERLESRS